LRYFRLVDLHISNALELDGWVIWGVQTQSLPRRSGFCTHEAALNTPRRDRIRMSHLRPDMCRSR
jgi:hypothetical protein